jgi:hypothetical protein
MAAPEDLGWFLVVSIFVGLHWSTTDSHSVQAARAAMGRPMVFDFVASTINVSPAGPLAQLKAGLTNAARLSAARIPRSV